MEKNYHGYIVDSRGFIWNKKHTGILRGKIGIHGYHEVILLWDNKRHYLRLHRVIAECFCEKPEGCDIVNHLDSDITNNDYRNLEWTTIQGNTKHGYDYGRVKEAQTKATEAAKLVITKHYDVYKNNTLIATGLTKNEVAKLVKCSIKTIYNCVSENRPTKKGYFFKEVR